MRNDSPLKGAVKVCTFGQFFDFQKVKQFFEAYLKEYVVQFLETYGYTERLVGRPTYAARFTEYFASIFGGEEETDGNEEVPYHELNKHAKMAMALRKSHMKDFLRKNWCKTNKISTGERYQDLVHTLYGELRLGYTYQQFLDARNRHVGDLAECSLLNSIKALGVHTVQFPDREGFTSEVSEKEESFLRECLLEVGDEICVNNCFPQHDPVLQLIQSRTTGANAASDAKGYAAEEALSWVFFATIISAYKGKSSAR